jgi:hypothetical protein
VKAERKLGKMHKCLCRGCGRHFRYLGGFEKHRIGKSKKRCCMTATEMSKAGYFEDLDKDGYLWWRLPPSDFRGPEQIEVAAIVVGSDDSGPILFVDFTEEAE